MYPSACSPAGIAASVRGEWLMAQLWVCRLQQTNLLLIFKTLFFLLDIIISFIQNPSGDIRVVVGADPLALYCIRWELQLGLLMNNKITYFTISEYCGDIHWCSC